jgi:hypothetical protein
MQLQFRAIACIFYQEQRSAQNEAAAAAIRCNRDITIVHIPTNFDAEHHVPATD